jgi:hypothetical protein
MFFLTESIPMLNLVRNETVEIINDPQKILEARLRFAENAMSGLDSFAEANAHLYPLAQIALE